MFELFAFLFMIIDGMAIGFIAAFLCMLLFGDAPFARLIRLFVSVCCGVGYFCFVFTLAGEKHILT